MFILIADVGFLFQVMEELRREESLTSDSSDMNCTQPCECVVFHFIYYLSPSSLLSHCHIVVALCDDGVHLLVCSFVCLLPETYRNMRFSQKLHNVEL